MKVLKIVVILLVVFTVGALVGQQVEANKKPTGMIKLEETHSGKFVILENKGDKRIFELVELESPLQNFKK